MDKTTVFTKTAKGITQVNQKSASLSKDLMKVLKLIDGKSNFGQLMEKVELDKLQLERALNSLTKDGFARVFQIRKEEEDLFAEDDFDFTAPGKMVTPVSTQRVVAGAANDISELVRQQEKADAERKAKEQAHEAARVRAKLETETRAKLEAEARARQKAEEEAMAQARRAKEAAERAKAEVEAKMREEEARKRALAEQQARLTAEQKAREEEESRRLAELRAKAEREAKALAEARARAEAEAQAMARARAEADAAAKRQAAEASTAEQQLKARLKDEIESRIRQEMESLLRNELEEKTRAEMSAQILAEARLAAKAELEERLREEREQLARAEAEARRHAEKEALERAESESRKRAEAEARAAAETEARMKAEEEARRLRVQAERAREEAQARTREQQETAARLETERRAKIEAEARAKVEAEERERRERELAATIDAERRAKEEAEARVRIEARARETVEADTRVKVQAELEADLEKKAEIEGKAQAKAYMAAKAQAELDEEEKIRKDQERKAREIAEVLRTRAETSPEVAPEGEPRKRSRRRAVKLAKPLLFAALGSVVLGIVLLHVVPLRGYTNRIERSLAAWLKDDVAIDTMTFRLVPKPHLAVQNVSVGKLLEAKAVQGRIFVDLGTLFAERPRIDSIELENVNLSSEGVRKIPGWGSGHGAGTADQGGGVGTIRLRNVNMDVRPNPGPFDATLQFSRDGALRQANLSSGGSLNVVLRPGPDGVQVDVTARNWSLPVGAPIPISDLTLKGVWSGNQIVAPELEGSALDGRFKGSTRVSWGQGVKLESELALDKVSAKDLVAAFTKDIAVIGRMDGTFRITTEGADVETLFASPRVQGKFRLGEGSISNIDLVAVMQSSEAGSRAGVTKFAELSGELTSADKRAQYRQVNLQGGVLRGNGTVEVANSTLSGRLALEIRSQVAQDRGAFSVSGTVSRPVIRRGG